MPSFNGVKAGWTSPTTVDGDVYAEPLVIGTTVVIATENNTVYGLNASNGSVIWQRNLGPAVSAASLPCGNVDPVGITSTPVADPTASLVYAVGLVQPSLQPLQYVLAAIKLSDGTISWHRSLSIAGFDPAIENQRGALALNNGTLYIPFGGRAGDCGAYHGYLLATPATSTGGVTFFQSSSDTAGGFWQPAGPSIDAAGNVYVTSGNTNDSGLNTYDGGETVFKLSPSLAPLDYFAPSDWHNLNAGDTDLGSTGPLPLGNSWVFQIGKAGVGYLLDQHHLGGIGGAVYSAQVCSATIDAAFGGLAYAPPYIYIPCSDGVVAIKLATTPCGMTFTAAWKGPNTFASPPIVAGGLLWIIDRGGIFYALDPGSGAIVFSQNLGSADHFATPAAGDGAIFVAATNQVYSFVSNGTPGSPPAQSPTPTFKGPAAWWCPIPASGPSPPAVPWWQR